LCEWREDVPANVTEKFNRAMNVNKRLEPEVMNSLTRYDYPGNLRGGINIIERMLIINAGAGTTLTNLPSELKAIRAPNRLALGWRGVEPKAGRRGAGWGS
jgi:DNA-binding NtrC family response regulator